MDERKNLKQWVKEHKVELLLGTVSVISIGVVGYLGVKYYKSDADCKIKDAVIETKNDSIDYLERQVEVLNAAATEGLYEEAIATVTRKLNTAIDRVKFLNEQLESTPDDYQTKLSLGKYITKVDVLKLRRNSFIKAQQNYEIIIKEDA